MEPHDLDNDGTLTPLRDFLGNGAPVIAAERVADPDAPGGHRWSRVCLLIAGAPQWFDLAPDPAGPN